MVSFLITWLPTFLYSAFLLIMATQRIPRLPELPFSMTDKSLHFAVYGILGLLAHRSFTGAGYPRMALKTAILAILLPIIIGSIDELIQTLNPYRTGDPADLAADAIGACVFVIVYRRVTGYWRRSSDT